MYSPLSVWLLFLLAQLPSPYIQLVVLHSLPIIVILTRFIQSRTFGPRIETANVLYASSSSSSKLKSILWAQLPSPYICIQQLVVLTFIVKSCNINTFYPVTDIWSPHCHSKRLICIISVVINLWLSVIRHGARLYSSKSICWWAEMFTSWRSIGN